MWALMLMGLMTVTLQSCLDDDDDDSYNNAFANALVTMKTNQDGTFFLQLDDSTTVVPTNMKTSPVGNREMRAIANLRLDAPQTGHYARTAYVNWIDTILTKPMVADRGALNDSLYGKDPVEIVRDWTTCVEDGYLTLRFRTYFGNGRPHVINLVRTGDYSVELRHNARGDVHGAIRDGLVAFRLSDLPSTNGKPVDLKVTWQSFSGVKSTTFKYRK